MNIKVNINQIVVSNNRNTFYTNQSPPIQTYSPFLALFLQLLNLLLAPQLLLAHEQLFECFQAQHPLRLHCHLVTTDGQYLQFVELADELRELTQSVATDVQSRKIGQSAHARRQLLQIVVEQAQLLEVGELADGVG